MAAWGNKRGLWSARRLFALCAVGLLLWQLTIGVRAPRYSDAGWKAFFTGEGFGQPIPGPFRFYDMGDPGTPTPAFEGKIGNRDPRVRRYLQGTFLKGDEWTGAAHTDDFRVDRPWLFIPVVGSPAGPGLNLTLCVKGEPGQPAMRRLTYDGLNPHENLRLWVVDARTFQGAEAYLEMTDGRGDMNGWLGVGRPLLGDRPELAPDPGMDLTVPGTNYGVFVYAAALLAALLFVPGVALGAVWPRSAVARRPAYLALPGLGLLAGHGVLLWLTRSGHSFWAAKTFLAIQLALALIALVRRPPMRSAADTASHRVEFRWPLVFYAGVCAAALQYVVIPLPIAQEWYPQSSWAGRMVACPPDNTNPYLAGVYLFHGKNGHEANDRDYFHSGWSLTSRGPLVPFAIAAAINLFRHRVPDPPSYSQQTWPADPQDYFLARILGILTNGLVVLGGIQLAAVFGARPGSPAWWFTLAWLALCPAVLVNTAFVWPKMLATCFMALAVAQAFGGGSAALAALFLALGYYSHPVGGLYLPCLAVFWACQRCASATNPRPVGWKNFLRHGAALTGWVTLFLAPWLLFKLWLAQPDSFAVYPLGDGNGTNRAASVLSWLMSRWNSFFCTLVPGHLFFTGQFTGWFFGPLSNAMRWNAQYTKTLPGQLGFALFTLAYRGLWRPAPMRPVGMGAFRNVVLIGGFFFSLLYWGFNNDGMGRQCLEPLTVLLLTYAGARLWPDGRRTWWLPGVLLGVLALESLWVLVSGFVGDPAFVWERLRPAVVVQGGALVLTVSALLILALSHFRAVTTVLSKDR